MKRLLTACVATLFACGGESQPEPKAADQETMPNVAPAASEPVKRTEAPAPSAPAAPPDEAKEAAPPEPPEPPEPPPPKTLVGDFTPKERNTATLEVVTEDLGAIVVTAASRGQSIKVSAKVAGKRHSFAACKNKVPTRVEVIVDGDHLFVLCLTIDDAGKPIETDANRYTYSAKRKKFKPSGGFGGEGRVDYQTIDLDER